MPAELTDAGKCAARAAALIEAFGKDQTKKSYQEAYDSLAFLFDETEYPELDDDGEPLQSAVIHWKLCFLIVSYMEHVGFDSEADGGTLYLKAAASDLVEYMADEDEDSEPGLVSHGEDQLMHDGKFLTVDTLAARVIVADKPIVGVETLKRDSQKIGRNDPCPCGSGKKYKHCELKTGVVCAVQEIEVLS